MDTAVGSSQERTGAGCTMHQAVRLDRNQGAEQCWEGRRFEMDDWSAAVCPDFEEGLVPAEWAAAGIEAALRQEDCMWLPR